MKKQILFLAAFLFAACADLTLPDYPDIEEESEDVPEINFQIEKGEEDFLESSILVGVVKGYDIPFSGEVYVAKDEKIQNLAQITESDGVGGESGSDIAVSTYDEGFFVIGRFDFGKVYFFKNKKGSSNFDLSEFEFDEETNLQDGVFNKLNDEFIFSDLNDNHLIILKDGQMSKLKISENKNCSPAKMKVIGNTLFVVLQNLNESWISESGEIAAVNLETKNIENFKLSSKNPVGKIEYNQRVDKNHFYIACAGSWQKRDGAILKVNIETFEVSEILKEADDGTLLDGDFVDLSLDDEGNFFIILSENSDRWVNHLLKYETKRGKIFKIDSGINAFATNPIDFSTVTKKIYYFVDFGSETFLKSIDGKEGKVEEINLKYGPAFIKVWLKNNIN